jgi:hypothetical protein
MVFLEIDAEELLSKCTPPIIVILWRFSGDVEVGYIGGRNNRKEIDFAFDTILDIISEQIAPC